MEYRILEYGDRYSVQKKTWWGWEWVSDYSGYDPKDQLLFWTVDAAKKWIEQQSVAAEPDERIMLIE